MSVLMAKGVSLFKAPMVLGYILAGAVIGQTVYLLNIKIQYDTFDLINSITLSLLGFGIGTELKMKELRKLGSGIFTIVIFEATLTFLVVGLVVYLVTRNISLGIIYGALASATAPAGTTDVINQYKASGNLTKTLYAVMGLDDIYALLLYSIAIPIAIILLGSNELTVGSALLGAAKEILLALVIGVASGFFITWIVKKIHDNIIMLLFSLGMLFVNCSIALGLNLSPILLNMCVGIVLVNRSGLLSGKMNMSLSNWSPPIYVIFFVLIGTKLDFHMIYANWVMILVYILSRSVGKWGGAFLGCKISKAPKLTTQYLGFTLLSQAGVAIGLTLATASYLINAGYAEEAGQLVSIMVATTFLIMLVGPTSAKYGLKKAGEIKKLS
ncbi:MAG: cation:proton antiporter [Candidatus Cloacimonadales bacterium]